MAIVETGSSGLSDKTLGSTLNVIGLNGSAGTLMVVAMAYDNLTATTPTVSLNKSAGETNNWVIIDVNSPQAAAAGGVRTALAYILCTVTSPATTTATWTGSITAKGISYKTFTGASDTVRQAEVHGTGAPASPTLSGQVGDLALIAAGSESPSDGTLPTCTSTDETIASPDPNGTTGGSGTTNATVDLWYVLLGSTGSRAFSMGSITDGGHAYLILAPTAAATSLPELVMAPRN